MSLRHAGIFNFKATVSESQKHEFFLALKALEEINHQQKVISDLSNRGFFDYVTGKLPESYKQLQAPTEKPD